MNNWKQLANFRVAAGAVTIVLLTAGASTAWAANPARAVPAAPADRPQFKPGEALSIATGNARLMVGNETVAVLAKGQRFVVVEVRGPWIGTQLSLNEESKSGWIAIADVVSIAQPVSTEKQVYAVFRPIEPQAGQAAAVRTEPLRSRREETYADDYLYGYRVRHETDPDMHVWEPWRRSP